ncbi:MAG: serine/threonine-protein kinase, partial [Cyanobacteria bacterium J06631_2]
MLIGRTLLSRYKITKSLGGGGFGDTYQAVDLALPNNPPCMVKHLLPKSSHPSILPIAKELFEREAQTLYDLGVHNQIPRLYAHFEENGEFYLVQEFIDGHDLSQEITVGTKLNEKQTAQLVQDILEVLAFVHKQNVIHRDIKPSNIMRRKQDGKLVLIDFGSVKVLSALVINSQGMTDVTIGVGSPGYMPSEQA